MRVHTAYLDCVHLCNAPCEGVRCCAGDAFSDVGSTAFTRIIEAVPQGEQPAHDLVSILIYSRKKHLMPRVESPIFAAVEDDINLRLRTVLSSDPEHRTFTRCDQMSEDALCVVTLRLRLCTVR